MKLPTKMTVGGQIVHVRTQPDPVYQFYQCPKCQVEGGEALSFPVKTGSGKTTCPACGFAHTMPYNCYVMGAYEPLFDLITLRNTGSNDEAVGTNFVHETIEAANCICDLQLNHTQISALGTMLYQAFSTGCADFNPAAMASLSEGVDYAEVA